MTEDPLRWGPAQVYEASSAFSASPAPCLCAGAFFFVRWRCRPATLAGTPLPRCATKKI